MRRAAALSDVHRNLPALEAVLAEVEAEAIFCCGDVAPGGTPVEMLRRRRHGGRCGCRRGGGHPAGARFAEHVREPPSPDEVSEHFESLRHRLEG